MVADKTETNADEASYPYADYFLPEFGVTVKARNHEEAVAKAKKLAKENK